MMKKFICLICLCLSGIFLLSYNFMFNVDASDIEIVEIDNVTIQKQIERFEGNEHKLHKAE